MCFIGAVDCAKAGDSTAISANSISKLTNRIWDFVLGIAFIGIVLIGIVFIGVVFIGVVLIRVVLIGVVFIGIALLTRARDLRLRSTPQ